MLPTYQFIGLSPNPLPLPDGLDLEVPFAPPSTPRKLSVRYTVTKPNGRVVRTSSVIEELPPHCTVRDVELIMHEMLGVSPRRSLELQYWGKTLDPDLMLKEYGIKDHSELTVVVKPQLPDCKVREGAHFEPAFTRLRVASHKLAAPIALDEIGPETTVLQLKTKLKERLIKEPIFLARNPTQFTLSNGETVLPSNTFDHYVVNTAPGGGGGKGGKGGGGKELRRVSDGLVGTVNDADLWEVRPEPEQQVLHFRGFALPEESTLGSHELTNNDKLYLFFKAPWEPDEWEGPKAGGGKEKGGKKK